MKTFERNLREKIKHSFKHHTLKMVLTRLDFAPIFGFEVVAADYQKKFSVTYPESRIEQEAGYDIDMSDFREPKVFLRENNQTYALSASGGKKKIKLAPTCMILEHHSYEDFESFYREFEEATKFVFSEKKSVFSPTRLGLRKISSLVLEESEDTSFKGYFDDRLTSYLSLPFLNKSINVDRHFLSFSLPDDNAQVNLQFSSEKGKKSEKDSRRFVMDIDVFSTNLPKDLEQSLNLLKKMNDINFDIFWNLIGPKTEAYLKTEGTNE